MPIPKQREEGIGHRATRRLEKIWVDLAGQLSVTSHTRNNYVMNIVDDFTNKLWSVPLKTKDGDFAELQAWILACENETGKKLKILHTRHDGEFNRKEHRAWYESKGIILEVGAPHTSAHIGCIECMHWTLIGKACSMCMAANCPSFL